MKLTQIAAGFIERAPGCFRQSHLLERIKLPEDWVYVELDSHDVACSPILSLASEVFSDIAEFSRAMGA